MHSDSEDDVSDTVPDKRPKKGKKSVSQVTRLAIEAAASALEGATTDPEPEIQNTVTTAAARKRE